MLLVVRLIKGLTLQQIRQRKLSKAKQQTPQLANKKRERNLLLHVF